MKNRFIFAVALRPTIAAMLFIGPGVVRPDEPFRTVKPAASASVGPQPAIVSSATYTNLADTSQTAPGQNTKFSSFTTPLLSGSDVAFGAGYNSGNSWGLYTGTGATGGAVRLADYSTIAPGESTAFSRFVLFLQSGSNVAFYAYYNGFSGAGIYTGTVGTAEVTRIADYSTIAPGQSTTFSSFNVAGSNTFLLSGSSIAFYAAYNSSKGAGLYTTTAGTAGATRTADYSTTAPGQSTTFSSFGTLGLSGSNVAFYASYNSGNGTGLYTNTVGTTGITRIADYSTTAPGQSTTFSSFAILLYSGSSVAFYGYYNAGNGQGLYTGTGGTAGATRIADYSMTAPGQNVTFTSFIAPVLSGPTIAFSANYNSAYGQGVYTGTVGSPGAMRIVDTSQTAPGQTATFSSFGSLVLSGSNLAFSANYNSTNSQGLYTATAGTPGATRLADYSTIAPGQSTAFYGFGNLLLSGPMVAFSAIYNSGNGVGLYTGTVGTAGATRIADLSMTAPGQSTTFSSFGTYGLSGSSVAFLANFNSGNGRGLYLYRGGTLYDVAATGESLFGSTISSFSFDPSGLDGNTLTYNYTLANGVSGVAICSIPTGTSPAVPVLTITRGGPAAWLFSFPTQTGLSYQLQRSVDLRTWTNVGVSIAGDGTTKGLSDTSSDSSTFWRVNVQSSLN